MRLGFIKKKFSIHGGAERYLQMLLNQLKKAGHEIHIFANQWTEEEGITFHKVNILPLGSFLSTLTFDINSKLKTQNSKLKKYDCIISLERTTCQDIYRAGEGCHAEWIQIRSNIEPLHKRLSFRINPLHLSLLGLEKRLFSTTKLIVANSRMVREHIIKHYAIPKNRITIIYNGVDLARFNPENKIRWREDTRNALAISENVRVLLFVGSGFERKGLKTLIDAVSLIKYEDIKVLIAGKGDVNKYMTLAAKHGISDKILFVGTQKKIERFYAAADLFILPTLYDPFSNATLEAMASGLPVITTRNNGVAELIENGHEGFVVSDMLNSEELSGKINLALKQLSLLSKNSRLKAESFPIKDASDKFVKLIESIL